MLLAGYGDQRLLCKFSVKEDRHDPCCVRVKTRQQLRTKAIAQLATHSSPSPPWPESSPTWDVNVWSHLVNLSCLLRFSTGFSSLKVSISISCGLTKSLLGQTGSNIWWVLLEYLVQPCVEAAFGLSSSNQVCHDVPWCAMMCHSTILTRACPHIDCNKCQGPNQELQNRNLLFELGSSCLPWLVDSFPDTKLQKKIE